jgi:hypothetical protein
MSISQVPYTNPHTGASVLGSVSDAGNQVGGVSSDVSVGVKGALTAAVGPGASNFILQDLTENGALEVPKIAYQNSVLGNLQAYLGTAPGAAGDSVTVTVFVNGVATALTCSMSGATVSSNDTDPTHRVRVEPGDRVSVQVVAIDAGGATFTAANLSVSAAMA